MFRACFGKPYPPKDVSQEEPCNKPPCPVRHREITGICQPPTPTGSASGYHPASNAAQTFGDIQCNTNIMSAVSTTSTKLDGLSSRKARLNASRIQDMDPENVIECDAAQIVDGLRLKQNELGRGTYGIVVTGTYNGVSCAVKVMLSMGLDRAALRELLLGPSLVHPNVVSTFATRTARLTHAFFDLLEGSSVQQRDESQPRTLEPLPVQSGDGFGDPRGLNDGLEPRLVLHQILHALGAETGQMLVIVVQEYCDCGTLDNAIRKKIFKPNPMWGLRLARRTLLRTAGEIARGLIHLHDAGVVHGDLKPANILLATSKEDRRGFTAKLADFGLSHVLPDAVTSLVTKSWGSIAYMAPEAFNGKISRATDVWAFGVILWEMLTGERPYQGMKQNDVIQGLRENTLTLGWPDEAPMTAPIIDLGRRCLSFDAALRPTFETVAEQLVAIERTIRAEFLSVPQSDGANNAGRALGEDANAKVAGLVVI